MDQPETDPPTERIKRFSLPDDIEERTERIIQEGMQAALEDFREITPTRGYRDHLSGGC